MSNDDALMTLYRGCDDAEMEVHRCSDGVMKSSSLTVEEIPVQLRLAELSDKPHAVVERREDLGVGREHRSEAVVELDEDAFEHAPEAEQVDEEGD